MKVVGYARTSWAEQEAGSYPGLEAQEAALRQFAEQTGLTLLRVYSDHGLSPTQDTRAGLCDILDRMEESWDAVLVTSLCRLRNPKISFDPVEELAQGDKTVLEAVAATARELSSRTPDDDDPDDPDGVDEDEAERRRRVAERLLKGREAGARAGKHQSGPAPYGYRRDYTRRGSDGVVLVPDEQECEVVRLIFREYLRLRSMKRLIKVLDEQGLRTRRNKRWSRAGISWILKNDTYVGRVHFGNIRAKGVHESIIPPILFNKVQKLIRANNRRSRPGHDDEADELAESAADKMSA